MRSKPLITAIAFGALATVVSSWALAWTSGDPSRWRSRGEGLSIYVDGGDGWTAWPWKQAFDDPAHPPPAAGPRTADGSTARRTGTWHIWRYERAGLVRLHSMWAVRHPTERWPRETPYVETILPRWARVIAPRDEGRREAVVEAAGWPLPALRSTIIFDTKITVPPGGPVKSTTRARTPFPLPLRGGPLALPSSDNVRALPLAPIWSGLLADSLLFAAPLWLLLAGAAGVRRRIRRRRGRCPSCGYPAGRSRRCSECGEVLPARRLRHASSGSAP